MYCRRQIQRDEGLPRTLDTAYLLSGVVSRGFPLAVCSSSGGESAGLGYVLLSLTEVDMMVRLKETSHRSEQYY